MARGLLEVEQPLFARQPPGVARQAAVGSYNAVAGHHNSQRVLPIGRPHGSPGFFVAQLLRQRPVRGCAPVPHARQRRPYPLLKRGAAQRSQWQVERAQLAPEVGA